MDLLHGNCGNKLLKEKKEISYFYKNKRILITGHTGFKGGWLSLFLNLMGAEVFGISDVRKKISLKSGFNSSLVQKEILTDINRVEIYKREILDFKPEIVFYLAAQPLVREAFKKPVETMQSNIMGLTNFLNSIRELKSIRLILTITSDKVYEHKEINQKFIETDRLGGIEPYSASKAMQEMIVKVFYESYFKASNIKMLTARAGNVLGGADWAKDRLIVDIIVSIISKKQMIVRFPKNTRPWQYVIDLIYGYLLLVKKFYNDDLGFASYNFAPQNSYPAEQILNFSKLYWADQFNFSVSKNENHIFEEQNLQISNNKIQNYIDWENEQDLNKVLKNTFDWYRGYINKENLFELNRKIINQFLGSLNE